MKKYAVVFERAAHNWAAYVPDLPGCVTTGRTLEETRRLIAEASEFHIDGMRLHGEIVPEPTSVVEVSRSKRHNLAILCAVAADRRHRRVDHGRALNGH
jgi:predicted RNase H-like HicB family nuclease